MYKTDPEITVLMPAYNASKYIAEAIASVLQQSFTNFELLIVNDGSIDNTVAIINSFNDARIRVINQNNGGVSSALNTGLKYAVAPYIARFDADDICHPQRLELQYNFMLANPDHHLIGSAADYMDEHGNYVFNYQPPGHNNQQLQQLDHRLCPFIHSAVFYRKDVVVNAGGYNVNALGFEDHLLWRNVIHKGKAFNFSQSLISVRLNPDSVTIDEKYCDTEFVKIKFQVLKKGSITPAEAIALRYAAQTQHSTAIKTTAYHALLAKKFLWNNHDAVKARKNLRQVLRIDRFNWNSYALFILSFLPEGILLNLYNSIK